jgi:hypothetical protein
MLSGSFALGMNVADLAGTKPVVGSGPIAAGDSLRDESASDP